MHVELQHSRLVVWRETKLARIGAEAVLLIPPRANRGARELGIAGSSMQDYMTKMYCLAGIHQGAFRYRNGTLPEWLAVE